MSKSLRIGAANSPLRPQRHGDVADQLIDLQARFDLVREAAVAAGIMPMTPTRSRKEERVHRILKLRRSRNELFGTNLFGEPAWDMLLDLYAAHLESGRVSISSLCIASGVPPTTALRWISLLERGGWLRREPDAHDRRRYFVMLTPKSLAALERFIDQPAFS